MIILGARSEMKGIILAGGTGSRLSPLTKVFNKHILPVGRKPMIQYAIENLVSAGINDILIITSFPHVGQIASIAGSGKDFDCEITYRIQDSPDGIAGALRLCESYAGESDIAVLLGDNIFEHSLKTHVEKFMSRDNAIRCQLLFSKVTDPERFGVGMFSGNDLIKVIEKPIEPPSDLACTGFYMFDSSVFSMISSIEKSKRNELEITDINNMFIENKTSTYTIESGWWIDAGTFESYEKAFSLVLGMNDK